MVRNAMRTHVGLESTVSTGIYETFGSMSASELCPGDVSEQERALLPLGALIPVEVDRQDRKCWKCGQNEVTGANLAGQRTKVCSGLSQPWHFWGPSRAKVWGLGS